MILGSGSIETREVKATLIRNGLELREAYADEEGRFAFTGLTEGDYEVRIEAEGYQDYLHRSALRYPAHEEDHFTARLRPVPQDSVGERLRAALADPGGFTDLRPQIRLQASQSGIDLIMSVPSEQVAFKPKGERHHAELALAAQIFDEEGRPAFQRLPVHKGFRLGLTSEQMKSLEGQPLLSQERLSAQELESGKQYRLVLIAEDRLAGRWGAAVARFRMP